MDLQVGGSSFFNVNKSGVITFGGPTNQKTITAGQFTVTMSGSIFDSNFINQTSSGGSFRINSDVILARDAANTFGQRNGTNAQTFRLYNTYTDASNYERGFFRWSSNVLEIGAEAAGTGTQRQLRLPLGTVTVSTPLSITQTWNSSGVTFSGFVVNFTDTASSNSSLVFDFQKNGASLFKMDKFGNFTSGSWVFSSTNSTFGDWNAAYGWSSGSQLTHNSSNRNLRLVFGGSATMLEFGGATSSFPALKRSSAILQIRLADDTGYTTLDAQLRLQGTAPATAGATGTAGDVRYDSDYIYICTAANTWKRVAIATWP
jgi:hypothetical protein